MNQSCCIYSRSSSSNTSSWGGETRSHISSRSTPSIIFRTITPSIWWRSFEMGIVMYFSTIFIVNEWFSSRSRVNSTLCLWPKWSGSSGLRVTFITKFFVYIYRRCAVAIRRHSSILCPSSFRTWKFGWSVRMPTTPTFGSEAESGSFRVLSTICRHPL